MIQILESKFLVDSSSSENHMLSVCESLLKSSSRPCMSLHNKMHASVILCIIAKVLNENAEARQATHKVFLHPRFLAVRFEGLVYS